VKLALPLLGWLPLRFLWSQRFAYSSLHDFQGCTDGVYGLVFGDDLFSFWHVGIMAQSMRVVT